MKKYKKSLSNFMNRVLFPFSFCKSKRKEKKYAKIKKTKEEFIMKISKDLADAVMMVACIVLVLIGTTTFESASTKAILMTVMAVLAVFMGAVRFWGGKKQTH